MLWKRVKRISKTEYEQNKDKAKDLLIQIEAKRPL